MSVSEILCFEEFKTCTVGRSAYSVDIFRLQILNEAMYKSSCRMQLKHIPRVMFKDCGL